MSKPKLLILNGSHSDIPLIEAGKVLGFHVLTAGNNANLIGHAYGDEYVGVDFSDPDAVLRKAEELKIDAVCSCANDFGAISAAYVAERLGLPGHDPYEASLTLHHKHRFKQFAAANGICTPRAVPCSSLEEARSHSDSLRYPLIVKPVDLTGGKGITRIDSPKEYELAVKHALSVSRMGKIVVEEFLTGSLHSFSTFLVNGRVAFAYSDNEYCLNSPFLVSTSGGPASCIESVKSQLVDQSEKIAECLSLCDGVFHIQFLYCDGKAWILEITRRCSGDFYPNPVKLATGLEWAQWIVKAETGMDCTSFPKAEQGGSYGRHCVFSTVDGTFDEIVVDEQVSGNIVEIFPLFQKGTPIHAATTGQLAGIAFLKFASSEEMQQRAPTMNDHLRVCVTPG